MLLLNLLGAIFELIINLRSNVLKIRILLVEVLSQMKI